MNDDTTTIDYVDPKAADALFSLRREGRIGWRALGIGMALSKFADRKTGEAWPKRTTLAEIAGVDERDVSRVLRKLEQEGFLRIETCPGKPSKYVLTPGDLATRGKSPTPGDLAADPWVFSRGTPGCLAAPFHIMNNHEQPRTTSTGQKPLANTTEGEEGKIVSESLPDQPEAETPPPSLAKSDAKTSDLKLESPSAEPKKKSSTQKKSNAKSSAAKKEQTSAPNAPDFPAWLQWVDACLAAGRPKPAPSPGAVKAAHTLTEWVPDSEERGRIMAEYLRLDDGWIRRQGYQLALLVNQRFEGVRESLRTPEPEREAYAPTPELVAKIERGLELERQGLDPRLAAYC